MKNKQIGIGYNPIIQNLLKVFDLLKEVNRDRTNPQRSVIEIARKGTHAEIIKEIRKTRDYNFLLKDESVIVFDETNDGCRYLYMQSERVKKDFDEYFQENSQEGDNNYEDANLRDLYEEYDDESMYTEEPHPIYIRYDVSKSQYKERSHPYSHIHIGMNDEIRIPVALTLSQEAFTLFVLKMAYRNKFEAFLSSGKFKELANEYKKKCSNIPTSFWTSNDKCDLFLS